MLLLRRYLYFSIEKWPLVSISLFLNTFAPLANPALGTLQPFGTLWNSLSLYPSGIYLDLSLQLSLRCYRPIIEIGLRFEVFQVKNQYVWLEDYLLS